FDSGQTAGHKNFSQVLAANSDNGVVARQLASTHCTARACGNGEGFPQQFGSHLPGLNACPSILFASHAEMAGLLAIAFLEAVIHLRRIDKIQPEDELLPVVSDMKTVAVIEGVCLEQAFLQRHPFARWPRRACPCAGATRQQHGDGAEEDQTNQPLGSSVAIAMKNHGQSMNATVSVENIESVRGNCSSIARGCNMGIVEVRVESLLAVSL